MAAPSPLQVYPRRLDPSGGKLDFYATLLRGDDPLAMLETGEEVASFTIAPSLLAIAAGLRLVTDPTRAPVYLNAVFGYWIEVDPIARSSVIFDAPNGVDLGVEITFTTTAGRTDQFTAYTRVVNK